MRVVPLASAANQAFTVTLDGARWNIRITTAARVMACDVSRDGTLLISGGRAVAGEPLIPYSYLATGNFIFTGADETLPDRRAFGVSQFLVYLSAAEIAELDDNPLTVGDLNDFTPSFLTTEDGFYLTADTGEILTDD